MTTPCWSPFATTLREISPRFAYIMMLRATSEMAAAMTVWSPVENPAPAASSRPCWRACTTSTSDAIATRSSSATLDASTFALLVEPPLGTVVQKRQALFEVEGRRDALEGQPQLHHREGDLGLNYHDHRFRAPQPRHVRDVAERADGERVHHVERGHVHDDAAGAEPAHPLDQFLPQLREIGIGACRLERSDEKVTLPEDRDVHGSRLGRQLVQRQHLIAEQPLRFLDAALQVAHRRHLAQIHADGDERLRDLGGEAGGGDRGARPARGLAGLERAG